jgi:hypothetical protein
MVGFRRRATPARRGRIAALARGLHDRDLGLRVTAQLHARASPRTDRALTDCQIHRKIQTVLRS